MAILLAPGGQADPRSPKIQQPFEHRLIIQQTDYNLPDRLSEISIQKIYTFLAADEKRNEQIINDVLLALEEGRSPILLTERKEHLEHMHKQLKGFIRHIVVLRGG